MLGDVAVVGVTASISRSNVAEELFKDILIIHESELLTMKYWCCCDVFFIVRFQRSDK